MKILNTLSLNYTGLREGNSMKKRTFSLLMLTVLIAQNFGFAVSAYAVTTENNEPESSRKTETATATTESDQLPELTPETAKTSESLNSSTETSPEISTETKSSQETTSETAPTSSSQEKAIPEVAKATTKSVITDELLETMTIASMEGVEYSQTAVNRVLNTTPVTVKFAFSVGNTGYAPGSTYTVALPDHLGYSTVSGEVNGVGADWAVDAANKTLTITFNQRVSDTQFNLDLKSYLTTESQPLVTIETPGQTKKTYNFDLFEAVEPIKVKEKTSTNGLNGEVFYNLDRTLSGDQTLELLTTEMPGAVLGKNEETPVVASYDVDIDGNILPETKQELTKDTDYSFAENTVSRLAITIKDMNPQKAYGITVNRRLFVESVSEYNSYFSQGYPTTSTGSVSLKQPTSANRMTNFTGKTSNAEKIVASRSFGQLYGGSFQTKGEYYITIYGMPTHTRTGDRIVLESKNGQPITNYTFYAHDGGGNSSIKVTDYFDVTNEGSNLVLTATKESYIAISISSLKMDFQQKDIALALSTPLIGPNQSFNLILDKYVEVLSMLNPNNAEISWGNYDQNGAYSNRTTVAVAGSTAAPIENLEIKVNHPSYLSLRATKAIYFDYYKLGEDYTVTPTTGGSIIKFTKPVTNEINIPIGFNYVPDSIEKNKSIPYATIPVTMSADSFGPVDTTVTANVRGSERTLQSSDNQFLVNARNDTFDSLVVTTKLPASADVVFDIYDVSNDQVDSIYPQYWDRGQYFDKPMSPTSEGYPTITFDSATNSYKFDFGKTNKRYIIEYKNANGWIDTPVVSITGTAAEPQYNNQLMSVNASVKNTALDILTATHEAQSSLKNVTTNNVTTKNIDDKTHVVKNPTFELTTKGTTNAAIDLNSINITNVPKEAYTVEETAGGAKIIFKDYTLTKNITITYNTISANAGQIYTETTIQSDTLDQMSTASKTVTTTPIVLKFSEGDAEGVVYLATAKFQTYLETEPTTMVPDIAFELVDNVTHTASEFTTDSSGSYEFDSIMSGNYTLRVTNVPKGYTVDDEYLNGKTIKLTKGDNVIKVPIKETVDETSITVKDSTLYVGDNWAATDNFVEATDRYGDEVPFSQITVTGTVDTQTAGDYEVIYANGEKKAKATIHVLENQEAIEAKDSTIVLGSAWEAEDNFVSATDKDGNPVPFEQITYSGSVETDKLGDYKITYTNGGQRTEVTIHVVDNQEAIEVKDSTIYVGSQWQAADNFVKATDAFGQPVALAQVEVLNSPDTSKVGDYEVTYKNNTKEAKAIVHVVQQQTTLAVKDSTLYVGDSWTAADNFIAATNQEGTEIPLKDVTVTGTVDTAKAGLYPVTYSYGDKKEVALVTVKADLSSLVVKDSTIYVGDKWEAVDNFISATDRDGKEIAFDKVKVTGTVATDQKGNYKISYTTEPKTTEEPLQRMSFLDALMPAKTQQLTAVATVHVLKKDTQQTTETTNPPKSEQLKIHTVKPDKTGRYPKTGTQNKLYLSVTGVFIVIISLFGVVLVRKKRLE